VASSYQRDRINRICEKLGIVHHAPLWGIDPMSELMEIADKFDAIITRVAAEGLDASLLGRQIDAEAIELLKKINQKRHINLSFEGGEAESFVLDAPLFSKRVKITKSHTTWEGTAGEYIIDDAVLIDKD
jgi:predicted ATP pyrophosphatase (TIGR00289 family)